VEPLEKRIASILAGREDLLDAGTRPELTLRLRTGDATRLFVSLIRGRDASGFTDGARRSVAITTDRVVVAFFGDLLPRRLWILRIEALPRAFACGGVRVVGVSGRTVVDHVLDLCDLVAYRRTHRMKERFEYLLAASNDDLLRAESGPLEYLRLREKGTTVPGLEALVTALPAMKVTALDRQALTAAFRAADPRLFKRNVPDRPPNLIIHPEWSVLQEFDYAIVEEGSFTSPGALEAVIASRNEGAARNWSYQQYLLAHSARGWTVSHHLEVGGAGWFRTVDVDSDGVAELLVSSSVSGGGAWDAWGELRSYRGSRPRVLHAFRSKEEYTGFARVDGFHTVEQLIDLVDVELDGRLELFETTRRLHYTHRLLTKDDDLFIPLPPVIQEERTLRMLRLGPRGYVPAKLPSTP
jgi:hypothetical protein